MAIDSAMHASALTHCTKQLSTQLASRICCRFCSVFWWYVMTSLTGWSTVL